MAWYSYKQNNSGGRVVQNDAVDWYVWIEAESVRVANARAEDIGIYFNGCDTGYDCSCCGDRWSTPWEDEGDDEPLYYDTPVVRKVGAYAFGSDGMSKSSMYDGTMHLYHADGTHERIATEKGKVTGVTRN
jgi:hypothetical protein